MVATFDISPVTYVATLSQGSVALGPTGACGFVGYTITGPVLPPVFGIVSANILSRRSCSVTFGADFDPDTVADIADWTIEPLAATLAPSFIITGVSVESGTEVLLTVDLPGFVNGGRYTITAVNAEARYF